MADPQIKVNSSNNIDFQNWIKVPVNKSTSIILTASKIKIPLGYYTSTSSINLDMSSKGFKLPITNTPY